MIKVTVENNMVIFQVERLDKLWAFKSRLEIPRQHILRAYRDDSILHKWPGLRLPGTSIPGVLRAGTFYLDGQRVFWDVSHPNHTIVIDLDHELYKQLVIDVENPESVMAQLSQV